MKDRNNSFDILRHLAAFMVLFSHQFALSGLPEPILLNWNSIGFIAVAIFFSISGFFMPKSFERSGNFIEFIAKRCKRIFPGLFICSIFMYFIIGYWFNIESRNDYILSGDAFLKTLRNTVFIQEQISGVFSKFIYKDIINGSLWTLPIEFACYIMIGVFLSISYSWKTPAVILLAAISATIIINYQTDLYAYYSIPFKFLAMFLIPFSLGSLLSMTQNAWWDYRYKLAVISVLMLIATNSKPEIQIIGFLCVATLTIVTGLCIKDKLISGKIDISYGIYIYAFPVQQITINTISNNFCISLLIATLITVILSFISYKYIELPFLSPKKTKHSTATII